MNLIQLRKLKWYPVNNWPDLKGTFYFDEYRTSICKKDVEKYVRTIFKEVSQRLQIRFLVLEPILRYENYRFFEALDELFEKYQALPKDHEELQEVERMLLIPIN